MDEQSERVGIAGTIFRLTAETGALIVYAKNTNRGDSVSAQSTPTTQFWANVVERPVKDGSIFAAVFAALPAGQYQVKMLSTSKSTNVNVFSGNVSEIDWR